LIATFLFFTRNILFFIIFLFLNFLLRGFYLPYSKNKKYYFKNLNLIFYHIISGLVIDIARFVGFTLGLVFKLFGIKLRLDFFIKK